MRACLSIAALLLAVPVFAAPPAPSDAEPGDYLPATGAIRPPGWPEEVVNPVPASALGKRNWLLAHLTAGQNYSAEQVRSIEQKLQNMNADQLEVLVRAYQQRRQQPTAADRALLDEARDNLERLKAQRDELAERVADAQATQQQLPQLNFSVGYGGYAFGPFGFAPVGGLGVGFGAAGFGAPGYGWGPGYAPAYNYALPYGYAGYPALGYGGPYPVYGGVYPGVVGPAF